MKILEMLRWIALVCLFQSRLFVMLHI